MSAKRAKRQRKTAKEELLGVCREFIAELRTILKRNAPAQRERFPEMRPPCHTCAFQPSTDSWDGFDTTMVKLGTAIDEGAPFYCHEPLPRDETGEWQPPTDLSEAQLCAGWSMVQGDPDTKLAWARACGRAFNGTEPSLEALYATTAVNHGMLRKTVQRVQKRLATQ